MHSLDSLIPHAPHVRGCMPRAGRDGANPRSLPIAKDDVSALLCSRLRIPATQSTAAGPMMEETLEKSSSSSLAAPFIFLLAIALQLLSLYLERLKKGGMKNAQQMQLQQEIKKLLKEASALSSPSTFAQAALLRRQAAAKEKELLKIQESYNKETKGSFDLYSKALWSLQVVTYLAMTIWFWGVPLAIIPQQLLQPFGKALSWRAGESTPGYVKVGVVPWLVLTARVSKFLCQKLPV